MVNITFDPKNFELKIEGHAGQAEKGEDIVCASVSMLFFTLAESLNRSVKMLKKAPIIQYEDGNGYLKCRPRKEYTGNIARTYWTILVGIELLAEQFSKYITFKVMERGL